MFDPDTLYAGVPRGARPVPDYDVLSRRDMRDHPAREHRSLWYHVTSPAEVDAETERLCAKLKEDDDTDAAAATLDQLGHRSAMANGVLTVQFVGEDVVDDRKRTRLLETYRRVAKSIAATNPAPRLLRTLSFKPAPGEFPESAYVQLGALCHQEYFYAALYAIRARLNNDTLVTPALKILLHQLNRDIMTQSLRRVARAGLTSAQIVDLSFLLSTGDYSCFPLTTALAKTLLSAHIKAVQDRVYDATRNAGFIAATAGGSVLQAPSLNDSFYAGRKASDKQDITVRQVFSYVGVSPQDLIKHMKAGTPYKAPGGTSARTVIEAVQTVEAQKLAIFRHQTAEQMVRDQSLDAYSSLLSLTRPRLPANPRDAEVAHHWRMKAYIINAIYGYVGDQFVDRFMGRFLLLTWKYIAPTSSSTSPDHATLMFLRYNARFEFMEDLKVLARLHAPLMTLCTEERPYVYKPIHSVFSQIVRANRVALTAPDGMALKWTHIYSHPTADAVPQAAYDAAVADFLSGPFSIDILLRDKLGFGVKHGYYTTFVTYDPPTSPGVTFVEPRVRLDDPNFAVFLIDPDFYMYILFYRILINLFHLPDYKDDPRALVTFLVSNYLYLFLSFGFNVLHRNITSLSEPKFETSLFRAFDRMVFLKQRPEGGYPPSTPVIPSMIPRFSKAHRDTILEMAASSAIAAEVAAGTLFNQASARHPDYMLTAKDATRYATALGAHQLRLNISQAGVPPADPPLGDSRTIWLKADSEVLKFAVQGSLPEGVEHPEIGYYLAWTPPRDRGHRTFLMAQGVVSQSVLVYEFPVPARDGCEGVYTLIVGSSALGYTSVAVTVRFRQHCVRTGALYEEVDNVFGVATWKLPRPGQATVARGWYSATTLEPYISRTPRDLSITALMGMSWPAFVERICGDARADDFDLYEIFYNHRSALPRFQAVVTDMLRAFIEFMFQRAKTPPQPCQEPDALDLIRYPMRLLTTLTGKGKGGGPPLEPSLPLSPSARLDLLPPLQHLQNPPHSPRSSQLSPPGGSEGGSPPLRAPPSVYVPGSPSVYSRSERDTADAPVTRSSTTPASSASVSEIPATPRPAPGFMRDLETGLEECRGKLAIYMGTTTYVEKPDVNEGLLSDVDDCLDGLEAEMKLLSLRLAPEVGQGPLIWEKYKKEIATMRRTIVEFRRPDSRKK